MIYEPHDIRFIQDSYVSSGPDALYVDTPVVPEGVIRTLLQLCMFASVAETKDIWFNIVAAHSGNLYPIIRPASASYDFAGRSIPAITEGMELVLGPGDKVRAYRASATAGSQIYIAQRYIDVDLPFYDYIDQHEKSRLLKFKRSIVPGAVPNVFGGKPSTGGQVSIMPVGKGSVPRPK